MGSYFYVVADAVSLGVLSSFVESVDFRVDGDYVAVSEESVRLVRVSPRSDSEEDFGRWAAVRGYFCAAWDFDGEACAFYARVV